MAARVGAIVLEEGYVQNFRKTRVQTRAQRQELAGVVVNVHPNAGRHERDALKATLYNCVRNGPASQNRDGHPDFRAHLAGRVAWVRQRNPAAAVRLEALLARIAW